MNDHLIKNKINHYLNNHPFFNFSKIQVFVCRGEVVLTGTVFTSEEKTFAETIVKQINGVSGVISKIELFSEATTGRLPKLQAILACI